MFQVQSKSLRNINLLIWFLGIIALLALDQFAKFYARHNLLFNESVSVIPGVLDFRLLFNTGAAFSFLSGKTEFLAIFSLLVSLALIYFAIQKMQQLSKIQLGFLVFVTAGALGNLIDRFYFHQVTDFIDLLVLPGDFPVFNLADLFINISLFFLILDYFKTFKTSKNPDSAGQYSEDNSRGLG